MNKKKLKFAVIGCGRVSNNHLKALTSGKIDGELAAICDVDGKKAKAKSEEFKVPYYLDYHDMMKKHQEIDVVDIATPTGYHARHVIDVARYGKHIIVEKPMALRVSDCDAMMKACADGRCRLFVVKQNRFNPAVVSARQALDSGRFGKMVMGTVRVRWKRVQSYYEQDDWHGTWELDGGVMSQQASHHLDLLQWFMGPIESMQCISATRLLDIEVEDTSLATFKFKSGALGAYEATVASRPEDLEGSLSLLGEKGTVIIGGHAVNKILYWKFQDEQPGDMHMLSESSQEVPNVYGHGHSPYIANVIDAIVNSKPALVEAPEGRKNIEILTALYESAALGGHKVHPGCTVVKSLLGQKPA
ncbi:MAG TPA: oxidoreductase [Lentisphaeria bacterium]|nr:MAG: oxidoreductase [Lentisphaerae bacterium GWF2_50_93]HCE46635.1 oxidoreductase [Lentisphaeria bacterium]